jgi:hypothetical protein
MKKNNLAQITRYVKQSRNSQCHMKLKEKSGYRDEKQG